MAIGILFLLMAAQQWKKRPKQGEEPKTPTGWPASIPRHRQGPRCSASRSRAPTRRTWRSPSPRPHRSPRRTRPDRHGDRDRRFIAIGSPTVAGAVLFYLVDADRAAHPLAPIKQFMSDNNAVIMMVVLLLLGAKLLGDGLADLWR